MAVEVAVGTPLAEALQELVQPKLVEVGWSTGGDDSALSEYIILMLVNGKTQEQIASELSNDLLGLGPEDSGATDFSRWLFNQVVILDRQLSGAQEATSIAPAAAEASQIEQARDSEMGGQMAPSEQQDADMDEAADGPAGAIPTGPKAMRNGASKTRDKRILGQVNKAMDRTGDAALHRVKGAAGVGRVTTHAREPPKGPRSSLARNINHHMGNGRPMPPMGPMGQPTQSPVMPMMPMMPGMPGMPGMPMGPSNPLMNLTPDQQVQLFKMYEQQAAYVAQKLLEGQGVLNPAFQQNGNGPQSGKSLFDRVDGRRQRQNLRRPPPGEDKKETPQPANNTGSTSSMDVEPSTQPASKDPFDILCRFNLQCTKADCPFAHQSPAAPPGITVDMSDTCSYGAACKNHKCAGKHPSPAKKSAFKAEAECKYWPYCSNPACPFKHPDMPPCRNGADCPMRPNCKFAHTNVECIHNPCTRLNCLYKHKEGQKKGKFEDKVWKADGEKGHVSERKFVDDDGEEELIIPGSGGSQPEGEETHEMETQIFTGDTQIAT
ncbi:hypothetical protein W97_04745 [Coniosporium apollinis CBS 100218]|uniref:Nab2-like CCCH zinc finger domain-containing protein n=1 Tax=Coniosporium apollinis (strain CBS 100218) TaxID=1168221 RepID=R7YUC6_CONA1|nr:uncharacterized protein W97_04745 [Coniosporium apollinis CBS 100218]EON65507.1 hypothetical protein W97_04745 [Coniosporium apollinis CBS 100218]